MESNTSLSTSDLNSAFCNTSRSSLCSRDSLSSGDVVSSRQTCGCEQSACSEAQVISSNVSLCAGMDTSSTRVETSTQSVSSSSVPMGETQSNSIYLDNGADHHAKPPTPKPKARLTMAERARLEALASFGGASLDCVMKKHEGLRDKLKRQKEAQAKPTDRPEVEPRHGNTGHGGGECTTFSSSLGDLQVKKVDLRAKLKQEAADKGQENTLLPPAKKSRHQLSHEQLQSCVSFGDCVKHEGRDGPPSFRTQNAINSSTESVPTVKRMTRIERSKIESLQSFGTSLQDLNVKPKIPKILEEKLAIKRKN